MDIAVFGVHVTLFPTGAVLLLALVAILAFLAWKLVSFLAGMSGWKNNGLR